MPCWQKLSSSHAKWRLTWKSIWSKGIEFFHAVNIVPIDIHQCLLNVNRDQTVDVSTVRWWLMCFSNVHSEKPHSRLSCIVASPRNEECLNQIINILQPENWMLSWVCWKQYWQYSNIAKFVPNWYYRCLHNAESLPNASTSGSAEALHSWRWQFLFSITPGDKK